MLLRYTFRGYQADFGLKYRSLPAIKSLRPKYSKILWLSTSLFLVLLVVTFSTINIYTKSNKFREHVLRVWHVCPAWLQPVCESVQLSCIQLFATPSQSLWMTSWKTGSGNDMLPFCRISSKVKAAPYHNSTYCCWVILQRQPWVLS